MGELNRDNLNGMGASQSSDRAKQARRIFALEQAIRQTLSDDPHLTDAELIELSAGVMEIEEERRLLAHVDHCAVCAAGLHGLRAGLSTWDDPAVLMRRERRIRREEVMSRGDEPEKPWWMSIGELVSLATFRPGLAMAAAGDEIGVVHFPIYEGEFAVVGLSGVIQRRRQAYYIHLTASQSAGSDYGLRQVEVVVVDPDSGKTLIHRKAGFGQFVLLGTNLQIGAQRIAARLLP